MKGRLRVAMATSACCKELTRIVVAMLEGSMGDGGHVSVHVDVNGKTG